ncbi:hypothetical protein AVEN_91331-1 [Araneus ventricosus]|uniref:Uncharacterized protein n=1 Tax=Araneus ventricosus TaxID=182803 RepID=A0A4Y2LBC1_ARAVE|nr:hypothetical protein AVEN_91331-1 [Araneus ventricosus]
MAIRTPTSVSDSYRGNRSSLEFGCQGRVGLTPLWLTSRRGNAKIAVALKALGRLDRSGEVLVNVRTLKTNESTDDDFSTVSTN